MIMLDNTWKLIYRTTHKPNTEDNSKNFAVVLLKAFIHSYIECNDSKIITEHIFYKPRNECYAALRLLLPLINDVSDIVVRIWVALCSNPFYFFTVVLSWRIIANEYNGGVSFWRYAIVLKANDGNAIGFTKFFEIQRISFEFQGIGIAIFPRKIWAEI